MAWATVSADMASHSWNQLVSHSWETPEQADHRWEEAEEEAGPWGSEDVDTDPCSQEEAAAASFLEVLMDLYIASAISARVLCIICYWAWKAGVASQKVADLAKAPGLSTGHYSRHVKGVCNFKEKAGELYSLRAPGRRKHDLARTTVELPVVPPHEALMREVEANPDMATRLQAAVASEALPPSYMEHPLVRTGSCSVLPLALYLDGVPYSLTDSVVGIWVYNLLTGLRHLVCVVRKRLCCTCGCRSWCTFWPILAWLRWSFGALHDGVYPPCRHDSASWQEPGDLGRKRLAGSNMKMKAVVVWVKGDWMEFCERLGYPTWASNMRPCMCCNAHGADLFKTTGLGLLRAPWRDNRDEDFETACARCEVRVVLDAESHKLLKSLLRYDKRPSGAKGRALTQPVPRLGLLEKDRLEPSPTLPDVGCFDNLANFPVEVTFWRQSLETCCCHRCPLWDPRIGFTATRCLTFDMLHTFHLGVLQSWCKKALWSLLQAQCWGRAGNREELQEACMQMRSDLFAWYKQRQQQHPGEELTQISDLVPSMLGTFEKPALKVKAAECWGFALFTIDMLVRSVAHSGLADLDCMLEAGKALRDYMGILHGNGVNLSPATVQDTSIVAVGL